MYSSTNIFKKKLKFKKPKNTSSMLRDNPHKRGQVLRIRINTPRKPNSARRKTLKLKFTNNIKPVVYVPGGNHSLKRFSTVLVRGRGPRDVPGVYLSAIRGCFDLLPPTIPTKTKRKSIYSIKNFNKKDKKHFSKRKRSK